MSVPDNDSPLQRRLTLFDTTLLVVGGIVGTGVFFNTSNVAQFVHTPGLILTAWIIGGIIALIGALSFAELGAMLPKVGGNYVFLREGIHPLVAFLYGWTMLVLIVSGACAAVAMKFSETLLTMLPQSEPPSPALIKIVGLAAVWGLTAVNYFGVKPGTVVQNIFTSGKLIALAVLIVLGLTLPRETHLSLQTFFERGYEGNLFVALGAALAPVLFAYGGWQNSTYTAGEVKDPQRTLPRALTLGILIVIAVYLLVAVVYLRVLPVDAIRSSGTVATDTARQLIGRAGAQFVSGAIVISTFGFIDMTILTAPRVFFAMARDGYLIRAAAYLHPKYQSPVVVLVLFAALTSFYLLAGSYGALLSYATFGDWIFFGLAVLTVFTLRRKHPEWPRPYRVWGYPITPAIFVLVAFTFVIINFCVNQPQSTYGLGLILLGVPAFYFFRILNRS